MNYIVDLSSSLSSDYGKLYESGKYTDVSIHVGKEPNNKIFFAHTVILCARSIYLENSLTENMKASKEIQQTAMTIENVSPVIFEILLG